MNGDNDDDDDDDDDNDYDDKDGRTYCAMMTTMICFGLRPTPQRRRSESGTPPSSRSLSLWCFGHWTRQLMLSSSKLQGPISGMLTQEEKQRV